MPDTEISNLPLLSEAQLQADDVLAIADVSLLETKKVRSDALVSAGINLLANGTIDPNKINWTGYTFPVAPAAGSITNVELADNCVVTSKLADASITGPKISFVNGDSIVVGSITADRVSSTAVGRGIDIDSANIGIANAILAGQRNGIIWNEHGLITGDIALSAGDLPPATESQIGAVSVPSGSGLSVSATGALTHSNSITPGGVSGFTYDEHGHIINATALVGTDLPVASATDLGAVKIPNSGTGPLLVSADGSLTHRLIVGGAVSGLASVDVDAFGLVTAGSSILIPDQVPDLDASKIISGQFPTGRLADASILAKKLADYGTCLMQEESPGASDDYFLGMLWFQPSTAQLRVYGRGSSGTQWSPVGFGALQANNLRWGGVFDAAAGTVEVLTNQGVSAGLVVGQLIPSPSDDLSGLYLICNNDGNNVPQNFVSTVSFVSGDWLLCINELQGYTHISVGSSGGGGSGYLSGLLDVSLTNLVPEDRLQYDASNGVWNNTSVLNGGSY